MVHQFWMLNNKHTGTMVKLPIHKVRTIFRNWVQTFETTFWVRQWRKECHRNSSTSLPRRKADRIYSMYSKSIIQPRYNHKTTKTVTRIKCPNKPTKEVKIVLMVWTKLEAFLWAMIAISTWKMPFHSMQIIIIATSKILANLETPK